MSTWLVQITAAPRCTRLWSQGLMDGHAVHRDLMRLAAHDLGDQPRKTAGLLWRAEETHAGLRILAQLTSPPRLDALADDFALQTQQRALAPLLDNLHAGSKVRYRIAANATKRHGNTAKPGKKGKLANLHGSQAELWWLRRATQAGLHPLHVTSAPLPDVLGPLTRDSKDDPHTVRHGVTRFEGIGVVTDPDRLRIAVTDGIGRARTYGCGLLSLAPVGTT